MSRVGVDFGTGNTVLAVFNETLGRAKTVQVPNISTKMEYRLTPGTPEQAVYVIPSVIHYSATETLVGDQVVSRGLAEHPDTFRWMKRGIAHGNTKKKKTAQGHKTAMEAGREFLTLVLRYAEGAGLISLAEDEFTFTAPVEAFETFQDWLREVTESLGIKRLRLMDEPTACVLGYHGAARRDDQFLIFDHGCGTLDVSVVKVDLGAAQDRKAFQLGQAGCDAGVGGMDLDHWIAQDFFQRHGVLDGDRREIEAVVLRKAEETKIALSDPAQTEATLTVPFDQGGRMRMLRTNYRRSCRSCEPGNSASTGANESCLGCLLVGQQFLKHTRETMDRALENAAVKAGVRRDGLTRVLVTGGTSLVPSVGGLLRDYFDGRVEFQSPFDAVAGGACSGEVYPVLQHDYAIESYLAQRNTYEFLPLFKIGTEIPERKPIRLWAKGACDGMVQIGISIFEVSRMKRAKLDASLVDEHGALRESTRVESEFSHVCLNSNNPTFITADPPYDSKRDQKRFLCSFTVDGQRRLLVTVVDKFYNAAEFLARHSEWRGLDGKPLFINHPVVRL